MVVSRGAPGPHSTAAACDSPAILIGAGVGVEFRWALNFFHCFKVTTIRFVAPDFLAFIALFYKPGVPHPLNGQPPGRAAVSVHRLGRNPKDSKSFDLTFAD